MSGRDEIMNEMAALRDLGLLSGCFSPGQQVTWIHHPKGGYGYSYPVDAVVVKVNPKTVTIRVKTRSGTTKDVRVWPESLRARPS